MKTGIFDTEHFETVYPLIRIFDVEENVLTIFTNQEVHTMLKQLLGDRINRYYWVVQESGESNITFIWRMHAYLNRLQPDLFIYSTVKDNHLLHARLLKMHPTMRSILTLHAINSMSRFVFSFQIRRLIRSIGSIHLFRTVKELNVLSSTMKAYLQGQLTKPRPIHNLPGAIYEGDATQISIEGEIRLVVPGSVDRERRDYDEVFRLLDQAEKEMLRLDVILLGAPSGEYGEAIISRANRRKSVYTGIYSYSVGTVPMNEFDRQMRRSHFVFIPAVKESYAYDHTREIYGESKTSGNIFDAVKYARPLIYPAHLAIPEEMQNSGFRYTDIETVIELLKSLLAEPGDYSTWQQYALESSMYYTVHEVRKRHPSLFPSFKSNDHCQ